MRRVLAISATTLGMLIPACQPSPEAAGPDLEQDLGAIAEARQALVDALLADDVAGIMAQLTEDHVTMAPGGPTPSDNAALEEWHQARIDEYSFRSDFVTDDIQVHGDIAIERWSGTSVLDPRTGGEAIEDESKGVWIWERQMDGSWKLLWSVWNSSLAP